MQGNRSLSLLFTLYRQKVLGNYRLLILSYPLSFALIDSRLYSKAKVSYYARLCDVAVPYEIK